MLLVLCTSKQFQEISPGSAIQFSTELDCQKFNVVLALARSQPLTTNTCVNSSVTGSFDLWNILGMDGWEDGSQEVLCFVYPNNISSAVFNLQDQRE